MSRNHIFAALAAALAALPLQAAPGDIPEKRMFGRYDKYESVTKSAPVSSATPAVQTASPAPTPSHRTDGHTSRMSPGNERIAYAIAKGALAEHGIHNPTREQLGTALNGGTVTTKSGERVTMPGVLKLRDKGMGWGVIAQKHGFKLGEVMRHHKDKDHRQAHKRDDHKRHQKPAHHKQHDKHERADWKHHKHERADWKHHGRPDFHRAKYERPNKPERPQRAEKHHRGR